MSLMREFKKKKKKVKERIFGTRNKGRIWLL